MQCRRLYSYLLRRIKVGVSLEPSSETAQATKKGFTLKRIMQEDYFEFEASVDYMVRSRPV